MTKRRHPPSGGSSCVGPEHSARSGGRTSRAHGRVASGPRGKTLAGHTDRNKPSCGDRDKLMSSERIVGLLVNGLNNMAFPEGHVRSNILHDG